MVEIKEQTKETFQVCLDINLAGIYEIEAANINEAELEAINKLDNYAIAKAFLTFMKNNLDTFGVKIMDHDINIAGVHKKGE